MMAKLYIDTEFNGFNGELISMALVADSGQEFYEMRWLDHEDIDPWVGKHVYPFVNIEPIDDLYFKEKLKDYLAQFDEITIVADWPEDIKHF